MGDARTERAHSRTRLAVARPSARAAGALSRRVRGGSGLVIGGRVLLAVEPRALPELSRGRDVTLVSGTNGKSTTTALIVAALGAGDDVATNREGANTATALAGLLASTEAEEVVLEVDEDWLPWAIRETSPRTVVLTNLSRDQLTRHHEVGALAETWRSGLAGVPLVIANADDPAVVWSALAGHNHVWVAAGANWTADSLVCPACGGRCVRAGSDWACDSCELRRPDPDWWLDGDVLRCATTQAPLTLDLPGRFNVANAALAVTAAHITGGVPVSEAAARLGVVRSVAGRFEQVRFHGHDLRIMLAKNPAGWLELLDLMADDRYPLVLVLNAEGVDGRDPSWIYDVSFRPLRGRTVVVQGRRATDLLVRLEHDGVAARHIPGSLAAALWKLPAGRVDVVGNYTAFRAAVQEVRRA
ncbi:MAG TPA: MurT ligase domain-containing protein [Nocardioides sp.]|uniref:MurT ligase domain-containing protein n=1 Tax=Nocardioides sp. TaxID=35761 RepID=UPI002F405154